MPRGKRAAPQASNGSDFKATLWAAADLLRGNMDAAEYKHVALGLIFLKYISDAFSERRAELLAEQDQGADPEDRDEYAGVNVFWVPPEARWEFLAARSKQPEIGVLIDAAMDAIERENPRLKGVLSKDYARPGLDKTRLGTLVDRLTNLDLTKRDGTPDPLFAEDPDARKAKAHASRDQLGEVYEYFLGMFAQAEGKRGGEFFTPQSVVRVVIEMLAPHVGSRIADFACGSGGMFVQSERFIEAHGGQRTQVSVFGQESNYTTWRLARMNLAIRGIEANLGPKAADSFHEDLHPDLRVDFVAMNPPFNMSAWGGERLRQDKRWTFGAPPVGNANFAWLQLIWHHLAPGGLAGCLLANGSLSSQQSGEGDIRRAMVEADAVDAILALPPQLFTNTQIPACVWFLSKGKHKTGERDRSGEVLFLDARKFGAMSDRTTRVLTNAEIEKIAATYRAWKTPGGEYADEPGFSRAATLAEIEAHGFILTPGRYVGAADLDEDEEPFAEKYARLTQELFQQFEEGRTLEEKIRLRLADLPAGGAAQ
ncbi:MAG TPA: class I SAM-dependent DNA methyltransferase [Deinococcales bacterium]|nr:class I SAM-dependent DNA methyltransferase [Deinococcales bacterium]